MNDTEKIGRGHWKIRVFVTREKKKAPVPKKNPQNVYIKDREESQQEKERDHYHHPVSGRELTRFTKSELRKPDTFYGPDQHFDETESPMDTISFSQLIKKVIN